MNSRLDVVATTGAPAAIGPYVQAMVCDGLVYCSGQIGLDPVSGSMVEGGVETETRRVLANLDAVLEAAGSQRALVIRSTVFLADLADFATVNRLYGEFFGTHRPARSTVQVAALPRGARVEIDVIARQRG
ncbi:MAG: RidA family protein [Planctomycetes bacterium]|nr:RidA family protein [Planctomycetota bacterium]